MVKTIETVSTKNGETYILNMCTDPINEYRELKTRYGFEDVDKCCDYEFYLYKGVNYIFVSCPCLSSEYFEAVLNKSRWVGLQMPFNQIVKELKTFKQ